MSIVVALREAPRVLRLRYPPDAWKPGQLPESEPGRGPHRGESARVHDPRRLQRLPPRRRRARRQTDRPAMVRAGKADLSVHLGWLPGIGRSRRGAVRNQTPRDPAVSEALRMWEHCLVEKLRITGGASPMTLHRLQTVTSPRELPGWCLEKRKRTRPRHSPRPRARAVDPDGAPGLMEIAVIDEPALEFGYSGTARRAARRTGYAPGGRHRDGRTLRADPDRCRRSAAAVDDVRSYLRACCKRIAAKDTELIELFRIPRPRCRHDLPLPADLRQDATRSMSSTTLAPIVDAETDDQRIRVALRRDSPLGRAQPSRCRDRRSPERHPRRRGCNGQGDWRQLPRSTEGCCQRPGGPDS